MKKILFLLMLVACGMHAHSQCSPVSPTGTPGLTPAPTSVPCIERGVFYDYTMYFENFDTLICSGLPFTIVSATIDSLTNFPCGITWQSDKPIYASGETGCIRVFGTTTDPVGEYALSIYVTFVVNYSGQQQAISGTLASLQQQFGSMACSVTLPPVDYVSRVIDQGNPCPAIGASPVQTSSGASCPSLMLVNIAGAGTICAGSAATLTANVGNASGTVSYLWSPGAATTQTINVSPASSTTYSVAVTDLNGSATAYALVTVDQLPVASFSVVSSGRSAVFTNTSFNGVSFTWHFGDGQTSAALFPPPHHYVNNGNYSIELIVTNNCGADTATRQVNINAPPSPCTPNAPTGTSAISPGPDAVPCIERGVFYDFTMQLENYDSFTTFFPMRIDSMVIDSIANLPCGITWQASKTTLMSGETGCVRVSGTTYTQAGQYPLKVYITMFAAGFPVSGQLDSLAAMAGDTASDYRYISRVIDPGAICPARDTASQLAVQPSPLAISVACAGAGAVLAGTPGFAQYVWSTGSSAATTSVNTAGTYTLQATDSSACTSNASYSLASTPLSPPEICIVGVDSTSGKNIIVWEKPVTAAIDSYIVYRETNQTGVYARIGAQGYSSFSTFVDLQSVPEQNSNSYKIGFTDTCGISLDGSVQHKTIHLSINQGVGSTWNLNWNHYEGFAFSTYNIYRGTAAGNLTQINSVASNLDSYTDLNPPAASVIFYQIEVQNPAACNPTARSYSVSRSNVVSTPVNGINTVNSETLTMYPNPFSESITIEMPADNGPYMLRVLDLAGQELLTTREITGRQYIMERSGLPQGIFYIELRGKQGIYRGKVGKM